MTDQHWISKLKENHANLKQKFAMQALANYIVLTMSDREIEELVPLLSDPTKAICVEIYVADQPNYGIPYGYGYDDLLIGQNNLRLGAAILANRITKKGYIAIPVPIPGHYWAVLRPNGGKYDKTAQIQAKTKALEVCQ